MYYSLFFFIKKRILLIIFEIYLDFVYFHFLHELTFSTSNLKFMTKLTFPPMKCQNSPFCKISIKKIRENNLIIPRIDFYTMVAFNNSKPLTLTDAVKHLDINRTQIVSRLCHRNSISSISLQTLVKDNKKYAA